MSIRARELICSTVLIWLVFSAGALRTVSAEGPYEGTWKTGPTRISVSVQSWGVDCGQRPRSDLKPGGGIVRITQRGHHLIIHGRGRTVRTDACWSPNRALQRVSSSFLDQVWTINCRTPSDDPKAETGEYTLRLEGDDRLHYKDLSRYNWELKQSNCVATITTTQTLTRIREEEKAAGKKPVQVPVEKPQPLMDRPAELETAELETAEPEPSRPCQPMAPDRLILQPKRAVIEPGQRVCFRARVVDSASCPVQGQPVQWSLRHAAGLRGQLNNGCFRAATSAAEAEGDFRIIASSGRLKSLAVVSVKPVDLSDLIAKRIESGAVSGFAEQTVPDQPEPKTKAEGASRKVQIRPQSGLGPIAIALSAAVGLGLIALILWLKRKTPRKDEIADDIDEEAPLQTEAEPAPQQDPSIKAEKEVGGQWICPTCRRGFPASNRVCPRDGAELMPYERFAEKHKARQDSEKKKRCPKCGDIYPASVAFCAKDGATLEPID